MAEVVDDESLDAEEIEGHEETDDRGGENGGHDFIFSHFMRRMIRFDINDKTDKDKKIISNTVQRHWNTENGGV